MPKSVSLTVSEGMTERTTQVAFKDLRVSTPRELDASPVPIRCPHCRKEAIFQSIKSISFGQVFLSYQHDVICSIRQCPSPECNGVVFTTAVGNSNNFVFPNEAFDFDHSGIPNEVLVTMEEALTCYANDCYRASALMIRRTLEILCEDRGAKGRDLKARIEALKSVIVLPQDLLEAIDHLRILGNDAAHVEAKVYEQIGKEEVEVAIILTKEILKATYQFSILLSRLKGLA